MAYNYFPLSANQVARRKTVWDGLSQKKPFGRPAIVYSNIWDWGQIEKEIQPADQIPLTGPTGKNPAWDKHIRAELRNMQIVAASRFQDDRFPHLSMPRHIHGESQGLAEIFGCKLLPQNKEGTFFYPVPSIESAADVDRLKLASLDDCLYLKTVEYAQYAIEVTDGQLYISNPVMTGPVDTANYILGSMRLMEWVYDEPKALHKLLQMITDVLITIIHRLQKATGNRLCPDSSFCMDTGYGLCSETRDLMSMESVREYESYYLRQIGDACGPYVFHGCGSWERTLPDVIADPNLMMINFQSKEMDLEKVRDLTNGKVSLSIGLSTGLDDRYIWPDEASFIKHLVSVFTQPVPIELALTFEGCLSLKTEAGANPWFNGYRRCCNE